MGVYWQGQSIELTGTFTDADGAPSNPSSVTCSVRAPDGTETTYEPPAVTNPETGSFQVVIPTDQPGVWSYRWEGETGAETPATERTFTVLESAFA